MKPRSCGSCYACCYAPSVDEETLQKDAWGNCPHLHTDNKLAGMCRIYSDRPSSCRTFTCVWLDNPSLPARFRPDRYGIMLVGRPGKILQVWELTTVWQESDLQHLMEWHISTQDLKVELKRRPE